MSGDEYEQFCKPVAENSDWDVTETPASGDQGVDLIISSAEVRMCVQCKRYSKPVGNKAVQEVAAGKVHYNGKHAFVVSNAGFTKKAHELAASNGVLLVSTEEFVALFTDDEDD